MMAMTMTMKALTMMIMLRTLHNGTDYYDGHAGNACDDDDDDDDDEDDKDYAAGDSDDDE